MTNEYPQKGINIYEGSNISFESASEDYCLKNLSGEEFHALRGKDVGEIMPNVVENKTICYNLLLIVLKIA